MCPRCKSSNLVDSIVATMTGNVECKNCGYVGVLFIEKDIKEKHINAKSKNKSKRGKYGKNR